MNITEEQEIVLFHYRLGVAISQWATVEGELRATMVSTFQDENLNHQALSIGLFSLEGFLAKLKFVDGVVSRKLASSPHLGQWTKLAVRTRNASSQRNKLAHWKMFPFSRRPPGRRLALVPWVFKKPKPGVDRPQPPEGSLFTRDIARLGFDFYALAVSLANLRYALCGQHGPHPVSAERAGNPPTIRDLVLQMRATFPTPQRPTRGR